MAVYIDDYFAKFGRMLMCHMTADTLEELHAMADSLGLKRSWFQNHRLPHYDVSKGKRIEAISKGAIPVTARELVIIGRKIREKDNWGRDE